MTRATARNLVSVLIAAGCVAGAGCKKYDPLYCDEGKACTDPLLPYCDLTGAYPASEGIAHTCIPDPGGVADAGVDDASTIDAGAIDGPIVDAGPAKELVVEFFDCCGFSPGFGRVVSVPYGINCLGTTATQCAASFDTTTVSLNLVPAIGSLCNWAEAVEGWQQVTLLEDTTLVPAVCGLQKPTITIITNTMAGEGMVSVVNAGTAIVDCAGTCVETFDHGTSLDLYATQGTATMTGWSGACAGVGSPCAVTLDRDQKVGAWFDSGSGQVPLLISLAGSGEGEVTPDDASFSCPTSDCQSPRSVGSSVTLTATPDGNSTFDGWTVAGCSGTGPCTVTTNSATALEVNFTRITHNLHLSKTGSGHGLVWSNPVAINNDGINCDVGCTSADATFPQQVTTSVVTLTAVPAPGNTFTGWSGCDASPSATTCEVAMTSAKNVTASFE